MGNCVRSLAAGSLEDGYADLSLFGPRLYVEMTSTSVTLWQLKTIPMNV